MTQNIYDTPEFFEGYSRLPRSVEGLDGAPEWPALRSLLPPLAGCKVLDLGCGYGWFCHWAAQQGAASVLGLDVSNKMLERARASHNDPRITYRRADLEQLVLAESGFDLVYSSLALHYIQDLGALLRKVFDALLPGGKLVFSIEHPIYMASLKPGWIIDAQGQKTWPVDHYQQQGPRSTDWLSKGVIKHHRTLGTLLNLLIETGFTLDHINEWGPDAEDLASCPGLADEMHRPMMLIVAASRQLP
ncbi:class I SAM-dependent methyltransferase [Pseudomonas versuta]|uniref:SAM-dependent methyltransferase n=1 Tax=Pseudomonas versuta TaxID=1788301 RepID=A0ABX3E115_9PSED|nr:class I SAM-dependent methyltransferase [Pseudomonas versuta]ALE87719.1 SAM-dependent methyltransferase [Pseudomonas versuta]OKA17249.1 SAM-dependent methyltransferase [Pseudomonas versuta]